MQPLILSFYTDERPIFDAGAVFRDTRESELHVIGHTWIENDLHISSVLINTLN